MKPEETKKSESLTIRITPQEKEAIYKLAAEQRRKPSEFIYLLVIDELKRRIKND